MRRLYKVRPRHASRLVVLQALAAAADVAGRLSLLGLDLLCNGEEACQLVGLWATQEDEEVSSLGN